MVGTEAPAVARHCRWQEGHRRGQIGSSDSLLAKTKPREERGGKDESTPGVFAAQKLGPRGARWWHHGRPRESSQERL